MKEYFFFFWKETIIFLYTFSLRFDNLTVNFQEKKKTRGEKQPFIHPFPLFIKSI